MLLDYYFHVPNSYLCHNQLLINPSMTLSPIYCGFAVKFSHFPRFLMPDFTFCKSLFRIFDRLVISYDFYGFYKYPLSPFIICYSQLPWLFNAVLLQKDWSKRLLNRLRSLEWHQVKAGEGTLDSRFLASILQDSITLASCVWYYAKHECLMQYSPTIQVLSCAAFCSAN